MNPVQKWEEPTLEQEVKPQLGSYGIYQSGTPLMPLGYSLGATFRGEQMQLPLIGLVQRNMVDYKKVLGQGGKKTPQDVVDFLTNEIDSLYSIKSGIHEVHLNHIPKNILNKILSRKKLNSLEQRLAFDVGVNSPLVHGQGPSTLYRPEKNDGVFELINNLSIGLVDYGRNQLGDRRRLDPNKLDYLTATQIVKNHLYKKINTELGYDSVMHYGGTRAGTGHYIHPVYVGLNPAEQTNLVPFAYGYHPIKNKKSMGGKINGFGTSMSDSIPAMLSNGEYVIRASSVDKYGTGFMDKLNQGVLKMAGGGYVNASAQMPRYNIPSAQAIAPSSTNVYNGGTTLATVNVYDSGNAKATAYEVANILNNMASRTNHKAGVRV
jgi:hypothetical protein